MASSTATGRSVQLNAREQQLRRLLLDVARSIDEAGHAPEPVVLRWAGGWVRDKLLNIESHDIDVAINAMTGVPFAQRMCDYCERPEAIARHAIGPADIGNLHNVARNPEKSKHLETAMVRMFGLDLDFVNLRKETYTQESRNPQMEFGTAQEDALRRDATVNALFYNLHTDQIEDHTGGLPDMDAKIIRTPLEPFQTFMDDPLRVLRLVRFASRLEFSIDSETRKFMGDPRVLAALRVKISRERVGVELEKMLKGKHPRQSLQLIDQLKLYHAIFTDPTRDSLPVPDISRWSVAYQCLDELILNRTPGSIGHLLIQKDDAMYFAWNLAAVSPWMVVAEPPDPRRKPNALPLVAVVAREGFKAPNKLSDIVAASHKHRQKILELKRRAASDKEPSDSERETFGMAIRDWDAHGGSWQLQVLNALLVEATEVLDDWSQAERTGFLSEWQNFLDHLKKLDVYDAPSLKRLLDGRQLAQALGTKPGKWTGKALESRHEAALAALAYLDRLGPADDHVSQLIDPIAARLLPVEENKDCPLVAEAGLACLALLATKWRCDVNDATLVLVAAYTDSRDPWTTEKASSAACRLLDVPDKLADLIVGPVLQEFLRPLFAKSSARVTASGRPSHYADPAPPAQRLSDEPAWKRQCPWAVATFQWAVKSSEPTLIKNHWPLFTPVLLTLAEDQDSKTRARGLETLALFVDNCPSQVLQTTGIGAIFQDVTFPALLFLPSLTPEEESTLLLKPAYDVLIKLAQSYGGQQNPKRRQLLDKILRDGIYAGYQHASEYARIVQILMHYTASVASCLGIYTVKHMQNLFSIISSAMTDPFATTYPPALLDAADALIAIIANCWPRLSEASHVEHIISIVSVCWVNVNDDQEDTAGLSSHDREAILQKLQRVSTMLQSLWTQCGFGRPAKLADVLEQEPQLRKLFPNIQN